MKSQKSKIIGRQLEKEKLNKALELKRNILIEGSVGTGKTFLVQETLKETSKPFVRIDGDSRYTEQKLTGWFDPPQVLKRGYLPECFIDGPLVQSMKEGKVLFINELNRMPEGVQNILLPAMDERHIIIPKIGGISAKKGFSVIATQNPSEFTATHAISEALYDRFEMISLDYQTAEEEMEIVLQELEGKVNKEVHRRSIALVRATREHPPIKRGASIRAAIAICQLVSGGIDFETACFMALPTRIEIVSSEDDPIEIIEQLLSNTSLPFPEKKKTLSHHKART